ncbi:uncharacterized protein LOC115777556 [Archocentrus centrarchus]|uniref:uncharacterized protein LOC115777556 n=1 Tax=Archocentrus centrarchus TaxID=63155 RepID=UPI0011E9CEAF|nr:uncharacterized protein LOC115777556 [Archocentrus centrarchus]
MNTDVGDKRDIRGGGLYHCRGGRGDPAFFSEDSNEVTVEETDPIKPTVILQPSWTQIFSGETVTVRCEIQGGGGTQWTYEWSPAKLNTPPTSSEYRISRAAESDSGGYRCRGRRDYLLTGWSDTITLTVSYKPKAELRADNTAVPVGGSVSLTCSVSLSSPSSSSSGWKYYWYRDEKHSEPLTTQDAVFLSNGQIRVSQEGLYRCRGGRGDPVYYTEDSQSVWINKTGFRGECWSFLVPFMVGLVCGSSLIVAVLLCCMCCRTRIKDPCGHSFMQSPNINQGSATPQTADQSETQVYSSLLHGDLCVYESVRNSGNTQSGGAAGEHSNAASTIQLDERRRHDAAEESSDYNNVNPDSASGP